ncbi:MAG: DUF935 domain-containing protein [Betaproteobacteria bacterium]|nr:DUF935 domain-containing protein [Betaproteobacteria bacterium]
MINKILDLFGRKVDVKNLKTAQAVPSMSRKVGQHTSTQLLDPIKAARMLRAAEEGDTVAYLGIAEEMEEKYLHYAAQLATRKRAVAGLKPEITPASTDRRDVEIAEFVRERIPVIHAATLDLMDALGKGFSVCEIIWDTTGKQWVPRELLWVDPRWFIFDKTDGKTLRLKSDQNREGEPLLPGHYLIHMTRAKSGLPIRSGLARSAIWAFLFQNFSIREWVEFIEQFGRPLRLGRYDSERMKDNPADLDVLFDAVRSLGSDASAILPRSMEIEFHDAAVSRSNADLWRGLAEYLDRQVSKLVLGQTLTAETSETGGGGFALGKVHNDIRLDILDDDAQALARTINRDLIPILVRLNFANVTTLPQYTLRVEYPEDLTAKAAIVEKAVAMGYQVPVGWFSETFGIPLPEDGEAVLQTAAVSGSGHSGDEGEDGRGAHGAEKYDAGLINAYSMGVDRLARLGVDIPVSYIRNVFDLPAPKAGEATLVPPVNELAMQKRLAVALHSQSAKPDDMEMLADAAWRAGQKTVDGWINQLEALLDALYAEDPNMPLDKVQDHLLAAFGDLETEELTKVMNQAVDIALAKGAADQRGAAR